MVNPNRQFMSEDEVFRIQNILVELQKIRYKNHNTIAMTKEKS